MRVDLVKCWAFCPRLSSMPVSMFSFRLWTSCLQVSIYLSCLLDCSLNIQYLGYSSLEGQNAQENGAAQVTCILGAALSAKCFCIPCLPSAFCPVKYIIVVLLPDHSHKLELHPACMQAGLWAAAWTDWVVSDMITPLSQERILPHSPSSSKSLQNQSRYDVSAADGNMLSSPCQHWLYCSIMYRWKQSKKNVMGYV